MGEFFKPWRRRIGMMTLVMALVFMVGWVRSPLVTDMIGYSTRVNSADTWFSADMRFGWFGLRIDPKKRLATNPSHDFKGSAFPSWSTLPTSQSRKMYSFLRSNRRWLGFDVGKEVTGFAFDWVFYLAVPYWSVVIPLTLISVWLLLSKPRPSTPNKFPETIIKDGGRAS